MYSDKKSYENVIYSQLEKESEEMYQKRKKSFSYLLILLTSYVLLFFVLDLVYSFLSLEKCQTESDKDLYLSLNIWFRVNGIYGISYYTVSMIVYYFLFTQRTFYRASSIQNENLQNIYYACVSLFLLFTFVMMIWFVQGFYMLITFYAKLCTTQTILVYLWIRLITGCITTISLFYFIPNYLNLVL